MRYTVVLIPDAEEGGYVAYVPSIPGCVTQGESIDEAIAMAADAAAGILEIMNEDDQEIPTEAAGVVVASIEPAFMEPMFVAAGARGEVVAARG